MSIKIGAACVRVSTDDQVEYSPASQIEKIREHAKREGYIIPDEYIFQDDGISGKYARKRPAFMMMIAMAKQSPPPFDCIFVWEFSRFARNQEESIVYKNLLAKNGVSVRSVREPLADSPFASLIERIIEWMDEYYLISLAEEVRRGMEEKASRGEAMGRPPFGYRVENKMYVPDENANTVRWIFEQYAAGRGFRSIAVELGEKGITVKSGKPPDVYAVSYILRNPVYIGKIRWETEDHAIYRSPGYFADCEKLPDGKHDPIIDKQLWHTVQERLKQKSTDVRYARKGNPVFMLKGLVRCSACGSTLVYRKERKAFQCYKYSRGQCHTTHYLSLQKANEAVITALEKAIAEETFPFSPEPPKKSNVARDWDRLIASEQTRLSRAKAALLDGAFDSAEYKAIKKEIEANIEKLENGKSTEENEPQTSVLPADYAKRVRKVVDLVKSPDVTEEVKNEALRSILDKIVYNKPNNTFDFYFTV